MILILCCFQQEDQSYDREFEDQGRDSLGSAEEWESLIAAQSPGRAQAGQRQPAIRTAASVRFASDQDNPSLGGGARGAKLYVAVMDAGGLVVRPGVKVCDVL